MSMISMTESILDDVFDDSKDHYEILEIGTANGKGTTMYLYNYFAERNKSFHINSYEGIDSQYELAKEFWEEAYDVSIHNKFFCDVDDIKELVIPNIIGEEPDLTKEHYEREYGKTMKTGKFEDTIDYKPDIVFVDCWRFCHAAVINKCKQFCDENTIFIMEDDFQSYGEEKILKKYFELKNLKHYDGDLRYGVWNFITFNL